MRKYLPSGAVMEMVRNATGGFDVIIVGPNRTFDSVEEALPVIYSDTMEVYSALKTEGISGGSRKSILKNPFASKEDMFKNGKRAAFASNQDNKKPKKKTGKKAVTHYTKKANADYKWQVQNNTGLPGIAPTYETFTPVSNANAGGNSPWPLTTVKDKGAVSSHTPTEEAFKAAAKLLGVSVAAIKAVYKTEVGDSAYFSDGG